MLLRKIDELDKAYEEEVKNLLKEGKTDEAHKAKVVYLEKITGILDNLDYSTFQQ